MDEVGILCPMHNFFNNEHPHPDKSRVSFTNSTKFSQCCDETAMNQWIELEYVEWNRIPRNSDWSDLRSEYREPEWYNRSVMAATNLDFFKTRRLKPMDNLWDVSRTDELPTTLNVFNTQNPVFRRHQRSRVSVYRYGPHTLVLLAIAWWWGRRRLWCKTWTRW